MLTAEDLTPLLSIHPEAGVRRVRWVEVSNDPQQRVYEGEADVRYRGTERKVSVRLPVKLHGHTCPECSRRTGHFYTAVIQVRGATDRLRGSAVERRARLEKAFEAVLPDAKAAWRDAFSWREELPEGWDYNLVDTLAARSNARLAKGRLKAKLTESATLWGRKNGRDVYRVTFCLRLPDEPAAARVAPRGPGHRRGAPVEQHV